MRDEENLEENAQELIDLAQLFEMVLFVGMLGEIKKCLNSQSTKSECIYRIRKMVAAKTKQFAKDTKQGIKEVVKMGNDISYKGFRKKIKKLVKYDEITEIYAKKTQKEFKKYLKTRGIAYGNQTPIQFFTTFIEKNLDDVLEGRMPIEKAIENAITEMSKNGIRLVQYDSGVRKNVDVWVRQQMIYAQRESVRDLTLKIAKENGVTIFEFDAHANARPSHQRWQGKRFDITGKEYPTKKQLCNDEDEDYGCLHRFYPVWDKKDKYSYSKDQLKNINTQPFEWNGKLYDGYEAKQKARSMERDIRQLKREKNLRELEGLDTTDINARLRCKNKQYRSFMEMAGTYPRNNRIRVVK